MLGLGFGLGVKCLVLKPKNFLIKVSNKLGKVVPIGDKSGKGGADGAREYIFITNTFNFVTNTKIAEWRCLTPSGTVSANYLSQLAPKDSKNTANCELAPLYPGATSYVNCSSNLFETFTL